MSPKPRLLVSACLLGEAVRFDGGHRRSTFVVLLGAHADLVPVCPEVAAGLGTPRPSLRLVQEAVAPGTSRLRLLSSNGADHTGRMEVTSQQIVERHATGADGAILKKGSPTCGIERVKIYGTNGMPLLSGRGLFAAALAERDPSLPIEDEGRLQDEGLRDSFLSRLFTRARLRELCAEGLTAGRLVAFHTRHKLLILAHSPKAYKDLGRLVARGADLPPAVLREEYERGLMSALAVPVTRGRHANVLQHMAGYVSRQLDPYSRRELHDLIAEYAGGLQPLAAPRTLLQHLLRRQEVAYLRKQVYLQPYPKELAAAA